jgi:hypothetical protein
VVTHELLKRERESLRGLFQENQEQCFLVVTLEGRVPQGKLINGYTCGLSVKE